MINTLKKKLSYNLQCIPGKSINKKLIIIESDDWGSIRMSSKKTYDALLKENIAVDKSYYNRFDGLASEEDLSYLFDVLTSFKDRNEKHPVITANTIVANPDFERIKQSNFEQYFFEPFTETLKKYPNHSFKLWKEGIAQEVFKPQLHGREHLNYQRWMAALRAGEEKTHIAFNHGVFGFPLKNTSALFHNYMAAFDLDSAADIALQNTVIDDAVALFDKIFNYKATSFIAPNYIWHKGIEIALNKNGVSQIQSGLYQFRPDIEKKSYKKVIHYLGQRNQFEQFYSVRNCFFEPSFNHRKDWVDDCLRRISIAFKWGKPAIICSHRVNYIGFIDKSNRDNGLRNLRKLLHSVLKFWPDVEFVSSDQLKQYL